MRIYSFLLIKTFKRIYRSKSRLLRENLEEVLEIQFPRKTESNAEAFTIECGICYSFNLTNNNINNSNNYNVTPDQLCNNSKCGRMYHSSCLIDWLQSVPNTRSSFGTLFGTCIYCQQPIAVRILK